uniref:Uncharacterized protein n=1 Tax=Arion vulgaris TaxID=1028688 RepID=A0A0B6ZBU3_9EUPU
MCLYGVLCNVMSCSYLDDGSGGCVCLYGVVCNVMSRSYLDDGSGGCVCACVCVSLRVVT